jgi:hypothetical protein
MAMPMMSAVREMLREGCKDAPFLLLSVAEPRQPAMIPWVPTAIQLASLGSSVTWYVISAVQHLQDTAFEL